MCTRNDEVAELMKQLGHQVRERGQEDLRRLLEARRDEDEDR